MTEKEIKERDSWLKARKKGLGGSEIAAILGLNPYFTKIDVFLDKTGQSEPIEDNKYMKAGRKLEPIVVDYFAEASGFKVIEDHGNQIIKHKNFDFILGTPDRFYLTESGTVGVLECKTTQKDISPENLPQSWFCQLQYYLGISGKEKGAIAWLTKGIDFNYLEVDFVPEFFDFMIDQAVNFWVNHVLTGIAPEPTTGEEAAQLYKTHQPNKAIEASEDLNKLINNLKEIREIISDYELKESEIINQLKLIMSDAEAINKDGKNLITWKNPAPTKAFNLDAFKKQNPEIYQTFLIEKTSSRRFLIK